MKIMDKLKLMFGKGYIRAIVYRNDKTVSEHAVKSDGRTVQVEDLQFELDPNKIFLSGKTPTAVFSEGAKEHINPLDVNEKAGMTAKEFKDALDSNIVREVIRYSGDGDDELKKTIMTAGIVAGAISLAGIGFLYITFEPLVELLPEIKETIEMIEEIEGRVR